MSTIDELKFDDKNFNKHTEFGMSLIEKSLRENGAGRSILLDKDNNIIAGNGIIEAAGQVGLEKVRIIETSGDEIVAVKRVDLSLKSKEGRRMALADNATGAADLEWDEDAIKTEFDENELKGWGVDLSWGDDKESGDVTLGDEMYLSTCYTKKNDIDEIKFSESVEKDERYNELAQRVESCTNEELKKLLKKRLNDFVDYRFDYIADFYLSGATADERDLMVALGLVIPTEKEAFQNKLLDLEREVIVG